MTGSPVFANGHSVGSGRQVLWHLEKLALPRHEQTFGARFACGERFERGPRCDKGRLESELLGGAISPAPQFFAASDSLGRGACARTLPRNRPFGFGQLQCVLCRVAESLAPARRKMP